MTYQIDQSGKIEQTERHTVIACINGKSVSVFLKKADKRHIQKVFKSAQMEKLFPYLTFAALVAIIIKHIAPRHKIIIDREYTGHEDFISEKIKTYCIFLGMNIVPTLEFGHVGKLSKAHQLGYEVAMAKKKATIVINAEVVLRILFGTKNRI